MAKVVVCVAWPYSNSPIHLGHVAGSLLPPDIFAKYHRLKGDEVLMVSGSDQHGTPVTVKAEKENVSPEEIAERYHDINSKAIKDLHIDFSLFTKTHTQNHFASLIKAICTRRRRSSIIAPVVSGSFRIDMLKVNARTVGMRGPGETNVTVVELHFLRERLRPQDALYVDLLRSSRIRSTTSFA
jgi:hypothetical protein